MKQKTSFIVFKGPSFGEKLKNWLKMWTQAEYSTVHVEYPKNLQYFYKILQFLTKRMKVAM